MSRKKQGNVGKYFILQRDKERKEQGLPPYERYANQGKNLGKYFIGKGKTKYRKNRKKDWSEQVARLKKQVNPEVAARHRDYSEGKVTIVPESHMSLCKVCNADKEVHDFIVRSYMQFRPIPLIVEEVRELYQIEFTRHSINNHCITFSLDCERVANTRSLLDTIIESGMKNAAKGKSVIQAKDMLAALKLRMDKDGELTRHTTNISVEINTPSTKAEREEKLLRGMERFGGRVIVQEAIAEVVDKVESES